MIFFRSFCCCLVVVWLCNSLTIWKVFSAGEIRKKKQHITVRWPRVGDLCSLQERHSTHVRMANLDYILLKNQATVKLSGDERQTKMWSAYERTPSSVAVTPGRVLLWWCWDTEEEQCGTREESNISGEKKQKQKKVGASGCTS